MKFNLLRLIKKETNEINARTVSFLIYVANNYFRNEGCEKKKKRKTKTKVEG